MAAHHVEHGLVPTWGPLRVAQSLARKDTLGVVAERDGQIEGFCLASYGFERAHVLLLAVRPTARRAGLGTSLMAWHEKCARVAGLVEVRLELRAGNDAGQRFYEALGFEVHGRLRRYYQGREDALRMAMSLREPARQ